MDLSENDEIVPLEEQLEAKNAPESQTAASQTAQAVQNEENALDDGEISFEDLGLDELTLKAIEKKGFKTPSPIQTLAIPRLLSGEANMIAKARTGTGKTAAFGLPIIQKLRESQGQVKALILEPTRELAIQTCNEMQSFTEGKSPRSCVLYGGASYATQIKDLKKGTEIVVGTPGRIQDHLERKTLDISKIDYFILDEGDEMLDMGFIDDIEAIFRKANPDARILLFSATMPPEILKIAGEFMGDYEIVEEEGVLDEPLLIEQKFWVLKESEKIDALVRLIDIADDFYGLVFTQTKNDADFVSKTLDEKGYEAAALHGDIAQTQREKILSRFRSKKTRILVATDVAARGIDISGLSHVVNYSLPFDAATYVHRIGRTGRAGSAGTAVTFVALNESRKLTFLQRAIRKASKGELKEEQIPTIDEVLNKKKARIFSELKNQLGLNTLHLQKKEDEADQAQSSVENEENELFNQKAADSGKEEKASSKNTPAGENSENLENQNSSEALENPSSSASLSAGSSDQETFATEDQDSDAEDEMPALTNLTDTDAEEKIFEDIKEVDTTNSNLIKVSPMFEKMASELCRNNDSQDVLAAVLSVMYASKLDKSRYGKIQAHGNSEDQLRLYVQLGKKDGYNARSLADYFSRLLHIPGRQVDRIDIAQTFSLISLPKAAAKKALEMSKGSSRIPHMHIDTKEGDFSKSRRSRDSRGDFRDFSDRKRRNRSDRSDRSDSSDRQRFDRFDKEERGERGERRRFSEKEQYSKSRSSRPNFHTPTERSGSAGLYKKKSGKAERF